MTPGGGGYGNPKKWSGRAIADDLENAKFTRDFTAKAYGEDKAAEAESLRGEGEQG